MNVNKCLNCGLEYAGNPGLKQCVVCIQKDAVSPKKQVPKRLTIEKQQKRNRLRIIALFKK